MSNDELLIAVAQEIGEMRAYSEILDIFAAADLPIPMVIHNHITHRKKQMEEQREAWPKVEGPREW